MELRVGIANLSEAIQLMPAEWNRG